MPNNDIAVPRSTSTPTPKINSSKLSVLICSCDKFSDIWKFTETSFALNWSPCPFDVFLMTNFLDWESLIFSQIKVGPDVSWSGNLRSALSNINSQYVLLWLDDCFLSRKVESQVLLNDIDWMKKKSVKYLRLRRSDNWIRFTRAKYRKMSPNEPYRTSIFASVWDRSYLMDLLKTEQTAWQFEMENQDATSEDEFFSVNRDRFSYVHAVEKGRWKAKGLSFARRIDPKYDGTGRGVESRALRYVVKNAVVKFLYDWCPVPFRPNLLRVLATVKGWWPKNLRAR